jgi:acyl-homoserine lactone acylase PvdQ
MPRVPVVLLLTAMLSAAAASAARQVASAPVEVSGLERPVQVLMDEWGVPHIYAERLYDAFAAQGFIAARDRLWQIDLWRKRGLGEMAYVMTANENNIPPDHPAAAKGIGYEWSDDARASAAAALRRRCPAPPG